MVIAPDAKLLPLPQMWKPWPNVTWPPASTTVLVMEPMPTADSKPPSRTVVPETTPADMIVSLPPEFTVASLKIAPLSARISLPALIVRL